MVCDVDGVERKSTFTLTSRANQSFAMPTHVASSSQHHLINFSTTLAFVIRRAHVSCRRRPFLGVCEYGRYHGPTWLMC